MSQEVVSSQVMVAALQFLQQQQVFTGDQQDWAKLLYDTWFGEMRPHLHPLVTCCMQGCTTGPGMKIIRERVIRLQLFLDPAASNTSS